MRTTFALKKNSTPNSASEGRLSTKGSSRDLAEREVAYGYDGGYIYCARNYSRKIKALRSATIYLSVDDKPFGISAGGHAIVSTGLLVKPLVSRAVNALHVDLFCTVISPLHPTYRSFSTAPQTEVFALDRRLFRPLSEKITAAAHGTLDTKEAVQLHDEVAELAASQLPKPKQLDPRIAAVIEHLQVHPDATLSELAQLSGLSYHRMSHLFTMNMGISVRSYQLWYKIGLAWRLILEGHKLAFVALRAGFCDAAHMCHIFQDAFGVSITYVVEHVNLRVLRAGERSRSARA